jgi:tetratricopeptide (TPR) repeat protein
MASDFLTRWFCAQPQPADFYGTRELNRSRHRVQRHRVQRYSAVALATLGLTLTAGVAPSFARDPFRTSDVRAINTGTETAFRALYERGDYRGAELAVAKADPNDPLTYAIRATLVYVSLPKKKDAKYAQMLAELSSHAEQTRSKAKAMAPSDPLRGNLYQAVGDFLEGTYIFTRDGAVKGTPTALNKAQSAFNHLDAAEKVSPNDPELNLIKGYIDLFMALNLPFSSPNDAIARLEKTAQPTYIAYRGVALGYRDLRQPDKALTAINQALQAAPNNPDLLHLKAQILMRQGNPAQALDFYNQALKYQAQLPQALIKQLENERNRAENERNRAQEKLKSPK